MSSSEHFGVDYHFDDMRALSELLEAEVSGKPFDRTQAQRLGMNLARHHPEIGRTMLLMCERMGGVEGRG